VPGCRIARVGGNERACRRLELGDAVDMVAVRVRRQNMRDGTRPGGTQNGLAMYGIVRPGIDDGQ